MKANFNYNGKEYSVNIDLTNKSNVKRTDSDVVYQTLQDGCTFLFFFAINEETEQVADVPCVIDVYDENGIYDAIYNFEIK